MSASQVKENAEEDHVGNPCGSRPRSTYELCQEYVGQKEHVVRVFHVSSRCLIFIVYPSELILIRAWSVSVLVPMSAANVFAVSHTGYTVGLPYTSRISTVYVLDSMGLDDGVMLLPLLDEYVHADSCASYKVRGDEEFVQCHGVLHVWMCRLMGC